MCNSTSGSLVCPRSVIDIQHSLRNHDLPASAGPGSRVVKPRCTHAGSRRSRSSRRYGFLTTPCSGIRGTCVGRFVGSIPQGLARIAARSVSVCLREPRQDGTGYELRAVIRSQMLRASMNAHEASQDFDDPPRANASCHIDGHTFPREFVDDVRHFGCGP